MTLRPMLRLVLVVSAVCAAACGSSATAPTDTSSSVPNLFSGTIAVKGSAFYSFTVAGQSNVSLTLASLTTTSGATLQGPVTLGLGVPKGTGCGVTTTMSVTPSLKAQIAQTLGAGIYCASITDAGGLASTTNFSIRILVVTGTPTPASTAGTETFASNLAVGGVVTRAFTASQAGSVTATLNSAAGQTIGFGIGLWDGVNCGPTIFGPASDGVQLSLPSDPGTYCVKLSDLGTLKSTIAFTVTITHP
jgi:hypothetical protein